jgi:hypothetical protein
VEDLDFGLEVSHLVLDEVKLGGKSLVNSLVGDVLLDESVNIDINVLFVGFEISRGGNEWGVLSAFSLDVLEKIASASLEHFVAVHMIVVVVLSLLEVIHVQLTNEGCEIVMLEVEGEDFFSEFGGFFDNNSAAIIAPRDVVIELLAFENIKDLLEELRDRSFLIIADSNDLVFKAEGT